MASGFDPGASGNGASGISVNVPSVSRGTGRWGLTNTASFRERGAPYDHIWLNGTRTGKAKLLTLVFPTANGDVPPGARPDPVSLDPAGKTSSAIFETFINPQQIQISYPTRTQVIQTIGGAYTDSFGYGLPQGQFTASFGWGLDNNNQTGLDRRATLKTLYQGWQELTTESGPPCHLMLAGNDTSDNLNMLVHFLSYQENTSVSAPFIYIYSMTFCVLRDYNGPANPQFIIPAIGTISGTPLDGGTPGATDTRPADNSQGR